MSLGAEVFLLGLVLSADSFSAAIAMGFRPFKQKDVLRFAASSGGAELLATWLGALAGAHILSQIADYDHWVAFFLLAAVAIHMGIEGIKGLLNPQAPACKSKFHSWVKVLMVSLATSLDALGVGMSLGVAGKPIAPFLITIGAFAFVSTVIGLHLARKLSIRFGPLITVMGSIVLGAMSFQMLKI